MYGCTYACFDPYTFMQICHYAYAHAYTYTYGAYC